jgi:hypothetical protein
MEMRKNNDVEDFRQKGQVIEFKKLGNFIDNVSEVYDFLHYSCYSIPDISINEKPKETTNLPWIRRNLDIKLASIENIRYIDEERLILEIKYLNGDIIKLLAYVVLRG